MLPTAGVPFLEHLLARARDAGIDHVVLSTSYKAEVFEGYFGDGSAFGLDLEYVTEDEPLGTGGGIRNVADRLRGGPVVVFNGDVLSGLDLRALLDRHTSTGAAVTLHLTEVPDPRAFGVVPTDADGRVTAFLEKTNDPPTNHINAGCYVFEPEVLRTIPAGRVVSVERETFPQLLAEGALVQSYVDSTYWMDLGTPLAFWRGSSDLVRGVAPSPALPGPTGSSLVMPGAEVAPGAVLVGGTVVGAGCVVEAGLRARRGGALRRGPARPGRRGAAQRARPRRGGRATGAGSSTRSSVTAPGSGPTASCARASGCGRASCCPTTGCGSPRACERHPPAHPVGPARPARHPGRARARTPRPRAPGGPGRRALADLAHPRGRRPPCGCTASPTAPWSGQAWGPGADWVLDGLPELLGEHHACTLDVAGHPLLGPLARRFAGLRVPRTRLVWESLVLAVLEQKVTGKEARASWVRLVRRFGEPGPRPGPGGDGRGARAGGGADAAVLGVARPGRRPGAGPHDRRRGPGRRPAAGGGRAGRPAPRGSPAPRPGPGCSASPGSGCGPRPRSPSGRFGDCDAVSYGDYHVAAHVGWCLVGPAGRRRRDDGAARPAGRRTAAGWSGCWSAAVRPKPRFGPRATIQDFRGVLRPGCPRRQAGVGAAARP